MTPPEPHQQGAHCDAAGQIPEDEQLAVVPIPGLELDQVGDQKDQAERRDQQSRPTPERQRAQQGKQQERDEQPGVLDPEPRRSVGSRHPADQPARVLMLGRRAGIARHGHEQARHREQQHDPEEPDPRRPRKEERPAGGDDAEDHQAVDVDEWQQPGQRPGDQEGHRLVLDRPSPPRLPDRR